MHEVGGWVHEEVDGMAPSVTTLRGPDGTPTWGLPPPPSERPFPRSWESGGVGATNTRASQVKFDFAKARTDSRALACAFLRLSHPPLPISLPREAPPATRHRQRSGAPSRKGQLYRHTSDCSSYPALTPPGLGGFPILLGGGSYRIRILLYRDVS